jgi:hypothetical protein
VRELFIGCGVVCDGEWGGEWGVREFWWLKCVVWFGVWGGCWYCDELVM